MNPRFQQTDDHTPLTRYLSDVRVRWVTHPTAEQKRALEDANAEANSNVS